jgi:predicted RNA-binding protein YlxR (DUF448 family)
MSAREPTVSPEDDDLAGYDVNGRMCIVTRESGSPDELIRFVAAPDGTVVADLKRQLPGRGCWVKVDRSLVDKAVAKKLFARALKTDVKAAADLGETVEKLLMQQLMQMMNMARKAGQFVSGSSKVDAAVRSGAAIAVFHATDAAADGVRKDRPGPQGLASRNGNRGRNTFLPPLLGERNGRPDGPERFYPCCSACRAGG